MTTALDSAVASAARLGLDEFAAVDLLDLAHPDWRDCTGDDDRCRCSQHEFRRYHSMAAFTAMCRQEEAEWLLQAIVDTAVLIQKLRKRNVMYSVIACQEQWLADLKLELKEMRRAKRGKTPARGRGP